MKTIFTGEVSKACRLVSSRSFLFLYLLVSCRPQRPEPTKTPPTLAELKTWQVEAFDQGKSVWQFSAAEARQETWGLDLKEARWHSASWQFSIPKAHQKNADPQIIWFGPFSGTSSELSLRAEGGQADLKEKSISGHSLEMSGPMWTLSAQDFKSTKELKTWSLQGVRAEFNTLP